MQALHPYYQFSSPAAAPAGATRQQMYALYTSYLQWTAAFYVAYGIEVLCLSLAKLMVLGRFVKHVLRSLQRELAAAGHSNVWYGEKRLQRLGRGLVVIVLLCGATGVVANCAAAVYAAQSASISTQAAASCSALGKDTNASIALYAEANALQANGNLASTGQNLCEVVALVLIISAFVAVGPLVLYVNRRAQALCRHAIKVVGRMPETESAFRATSTSSRITAGSKSMAQGMLNIALHSAIDMRKRVMAAFVVVLCSFLPRAALDSMLCFANFNKSLNTQCCPCCSCQTTNYLVGNWLRYTVFPAIFCLSPALADPPPLSPAGISISCRGFE